MEKKKLDPFEFTETCMPEFPEITRPQKKFDIASTKFQKARSSDKPKVVIPTLQPTSKLSDTLKELPTKVVDVHSESVKKPTKKSSELKNCADASEADSVKKLSEKKAASGISEVKNLPANSEDQISSKPETCKIEKVAEEKSSLPENKGDVESMQDASQTLDSSMSQEEEEFENMGYVSGDDTTNYADETYPQNNDISQSKLTKRNEENEEKVQKKTEEVTIAFFFTKTSIYR